MFTPKKIGAGSMGAANYDTEDFHREDSHAKGKEPSGVQRAQSESRRSGPQDPGEGNNSQTGPSQAPGPCPACEGEFTPFSPWLGLNLDVCRGCGRWLFDEGELLKAQICSALRPLQEDPPGRSACCPRCARAPMQAVVAAQSDGSKAQDQPKGFLCESCGISVLPASLWKRTRPKPQSSRLSQVASANETPPAAPPRHDDTFSFSGWDLPALLFLGYLLSLFPLTAFFSISSNHETGHAVAAWLGGMPALPALTMGVTLSTGSRFFLVGLGVQAGLLFLVAWCVGEGARTWATLFAFLLGVGILSSWVVTPERHWEFILASGILGEIVLPCLVIVMFHAKAPRKWRWDFFRYLFALATFPGLWASLALLSSILAGHAPLPMGSALGGNVSDGDLSRLMAHNWTSQNFISAMRVLFYSGSACVVVSFVVTLLSLKGRRRRFENFVSRRLPLHEPDEKRR